MAGSKGVAASILGATLCSGLTVVRVAETLVFRVPSGIVILVLCVERYYFGFR